MSYSRNINPLKSELLTKQACRDELVVYSLFFSPTTYIYIYIYIYIYMYIYIYIYMYNIHTVYTMSPFSSTDLLAKLIAGEILSCHHG